MREDNALTRVFKTSNLALSEEFEGNLRDKQGGPRAGRVPNGGEDVLGLQALEGVEALGFLDAVWGGEGIYFSAKDS